MGRRRRYEALTADSCRDQHVLATDGGNCYGRLFGGTGDAERAQPVSVVICSEPSLPPEKVPILRASGPPTIEIT
jgi:hypothetical protein